MWSVLALLLLVQQVFAGIFIPIHGYEKNVQKRRPVSPMERACWQLARTAEASIAFGNSKELAYANIPSACFDLLPQDSTM
ncbi:hypothetical protein L596_008187 [Steinernema carpocapsae]|uniref:Secreted protein n=1 Tax=Steinernema carpocapsae TaxID=34508 RepID=A0A4U5PBS5_STECR|nr:hypothetical protein L596_008187 [Steinernema carpocapsae]